MVRAIVLVVLPASAFAQQNSNDVPRDESAFVVQAPDRVPVAEEATAPEVMAPPQVEASSKVYFPDAITPESVARARAQALRQVEIEQNRSAANAQLSQVSNDGQSGQEVAQLSQGGSNDALAQLSEAERQVLLGAVEGTDICDRATDIPAIQALCDGRIETRSAEFAQNSRSGSAEDSLLGRRLDSNQIATLEAAISRLARSSANSDDFSNQVIASVALGNAALNSAQATAAEGDATGELSDQTQAVVSAIVQQLGGNQ